MDCSTMESLKQVRISEFKQVRLLGRRLALQPLRLQWIIVAVGGLCLLLNAVSMAQDRQADRARALLKQGIEQYKSLNFKQAQVTFLKIDASRLTPAERKKLDSYRRKVNEAIKKQAEALEAYDQAVEALKANQLEKARDLFEKAVVEAITTKEKEEKEKLRKRLEEMKKKEEVKLPTKHVVKKGECLWIISGYKQIYNNPFQWPLIYWANKSKIRDPDLIYPKQVFKIPRNYTDMEKKKAIRFAKTRGKWSLFDGK